MYIERGTTHADFWTMAQGPKEPLRTFIDRFKAVVSRIAVPDEAAISALRNAVSHESRFCDDLLLNRPVYLEDALHKATRYIEMEEEKLAFSRKHTSNKQSKEKVQDDYYEPRQHYNQEYRQETERKAASYLVSEVDPVAQPANLEKARRTDEEGGLDQYCDFHKRSGHSTAACRHLQSILLNKYKKGDIEVQHRQYKGHNNTYAARGGRGGNNVFHRLGPHAGRQQEAPPTNEEECDPDMEPPKRNRENDQQHIDAPVPRRRVNMIMGGLTACRDSVRSIKEYVKSGAATLWSSPTAKEMVPLTFTSEDLLGVDLPHNDPLVIELHIGESEVTRILIDTGSSVNVIFKDVLHKMEVHERHIKPSVRPLTGFDGNTMMTNGTIKLPIYLGGTATWHKFVVVDKPAIYNIILGTLWIHDMQAIPSSYHQCIKIPTSVGIETIRGNQNLARTCFLIECKLRKELDL